LPLSTIIMATSNLHDPSLDEMKEKKQKRKRDWDVQQGRCFSKVPQQKVGACVWEASSHMVRQTAFVTALTGVDAQTVSSSSNSGEVTEVCLQTKGGSGVMEVESVVAESELSTGLDGARR